MFHFDSGSAFDGDTSEEVVLADDELVEFHEFEHGEEGDDDFGFGGCGLEEVIEGEGLSWEETGEEEFDFIGDGEAVVDDIAEVVRFFEAFKDVLEGTDEVEDGDFGEGGWCFGWASGGIGLVGEAAFLFEFADGEEAGGVFEFFVFDELADEFPAGIVFVGVFFGRLFGAGEEGSGFEVHEVRGHDDKFGGEVDVEEFKGVDVVEVLLGDALDGDGVDIEFVLFDEVEEEVEGAFEDFEADFVIDGFQGEVIFVLRRFCWQADGRKVCIWGDDDWRKGDRAIAKLQ